MIIHLALGSDSPGYRGVDGIPFSPLVREKSVRRKAVLLKISNCSAVEQVLQQSFGFLSHGSLFEHIYT